MYSSKTVETPVFAHILLQHLPTPTAAATAGALSSFLHYLKLLIFLSILDDCNLPTRLCFFSIAIGETAIGSISLSAKRVLLSILSQITVM